MWLPEASHHRAMNVLQDSSKTESAPSQQPHPATRNQTLPCKGPTHTAAPPGQHQIHGAHFSFTFNTLPAFHVFWSQHCIKETTQGLCEALSLLNSPCNQASTNTCAIEWPVWPGTYSLAGPLLQGTGRLGCTAPTLVPVLSVLVTCHSNTAQEQT